MKTLVAEDEFSSRFLLEKFLSPYGECLFVSTGNEALQAFQQACEAGQPFDLICLDILMPEKDGHDALREIRAYERSHGVEFGAGAKIVMTSSLTNLNTIFASYLEWCDDYLTKPLDRKTVVETLQKLKLIP